MQTAQDWPPWMEHLKHPLVRDLGWLCAAPDLLATPNIGRPTLVELGLENKNPTDQTLRGFLENLDTAPQPLVDFMQPAIQRLGHYHERLWQYLLINAPNSQLLAHNLPITRARMTLGELDILYRQNGRPTPVHLEVAIKFYLGLPEGPGKDVDQARWIGPGGMDSLANKRQHLHCHQLPIARSQEAQSLLSQFALALNERPFDELSSDQRLEQRIAMPGRLFYPWQSTLPPPREAHPDHLRGLWLYYNDWPCFRDSLAPLTRGHWLTKPHWLAPPRIGALLPLSTLEKLLDQHFIQRGWPLALALHSKVDGWQRLFLVNENWPTRIPLPPYEPQASLSLLSNTH